MGNFIVSGNLYFDLLRVDPRIRRHVYEIGVKNGGFEEFEFLLNRFKASNFANDQLEMLRGLASTRTPNLLRR